MTAHEAIAFVLDRLPRPKSLKAYTQIYGIVRPRVEVTDLSPDALLQIVDDIQALDLVDSLDSAKSETARSQELAFLDGLILGIATSYRNKYQYADRETYEGRTTGQLAQHIVDALAARNPPIRKDISTVYRRLYEIDLI